MYLKPETRSGVLEAWKNSGAGIPEAERKQVIADVFQCSVDTVTAILRKGSNGSTPAPPKKSKKLPPSEPGVTGEEVMPGHTKHNWKQVSTVARCKARKHDDHKGEVKQVVTVRKRRKARGAKSAAEAPSVPVAVAMEAGKWADDSVTDAELDLVFATQYGLVEMLPGGRVRATAHGKRVNALVVRFWPKAGEGDE